MRLRILALVIALTTAHVAAQGSVSITALDQQSVGTLGSVTVLGNGFDAANSAISIIITARDGIAATVPAYFATATTLKFMVPPLVETTEARLFDVPVVVDVQVVQVTASNAITSNVLGGLIVEPAPFSSVIPGQLTHAFLLMAEDLQQDVRVALASGRFPALAEASQAYSTDLRSTIDAVSAIIANPERTISLTAASGAPLTLTSDTLEAADRVAFAFVTQLNAQLSALSSVQSRRHGVVAAAEPQACSRRDASLPEFDAALCGLAVHYDRINDNGRDLLPMAASAAYGAPLALVGGMAASGLAAAELMGPSVATALGLLSGAAVSHSAAYAVGATPPLGSTFTDVGRAAIDTLAIAGVPVTSGLNAGVALASESEKSLNGADGSSTTLPKQGLVLAAPPQAVPANARPVTLIPGPGIGGTARSLAVASIQQITALTTATLPPPTVTRFNGFYAGAFRGSCTAATPEGPMTGSHSGAVIATVSNGVMTLTEGASGTGTVSRSGQFSTPSTGARGMVCHMGGRFWEDGTGRAGATGFDSCSAAGAGCSGTWNLLRAP